MSMIGRQLSHYRIVAKIGEGGMGAVYRADDTKLGRQVALKILPEDVARDPGRLERFRREARALANLDHPNIVTVHSVEEAEGIHFFTMGLVKGKHLGELIPAGGLSIDRFFEIAIPLADALAAAHEKGVIHRDLKPENVMVTDEDRRVKVLDFGLAKIQPQEVGDLAATLAASEAMTREGTIVGTVPYMSPEQAMSKEVDRRSDIFSLGIVLYEMLTGGRPFRGEDPISLMSAILKDQPASVTDVHAALPRHLGRIVQRCLEKEPKDRYQTGRDVLNELKGLQREIRSDSAVATSRSTTAPRPLTFDRRTVIGAALVLALVVAVALGWFFLPGRAGPGPIESIVALPSRVIAADEDAYLTDAVPSNLSTHLARLEGLETKVPPTLAEVEKLGGDLDRLARLLGVSALVMTTVTAQSSQLVLDIQLVRVQGRTVAWSNQYVDQRGAYLELVRQAAEGLRAALRPDSTPAGALTGLGSTSEAELAFQRGKYASNRFNNHHQQADFDLALAAFEEALELDPGLVKAVEQIAQLYVFQFETSWDPAILDQIESWSRRALEMDAKSSIGWGLRQYIALRRYEDPLEQLGYALKAAAYGPQESPAQMGLGMAVGNYSARLAVTAYGEASRLDPLYLYPPLNATDHLQALGRSQEALNQIDKVLEIEPNHLFALFLKLPNLVHLGRLDEAARVLEQLEAIVAEGRLPPPLVASLRRTLEMEIALEKGDFDQAEAILNELFESAEPYLDEAQFARRWRKDEAFRILDFRLDNGRGTLPYDQLLFSPHLESLRTDARFERFLSAARADFEKALGLIEKSRAAGELPRYFEEAVDRLMADLEM